MRQEEKKIANKEKAEERYLLKQIEKVANIMA